MSKNNTQDSWLIRRDVNDITIVVSAHFIPKLEVFGVTCKVNGTPTDCVQSDDPVQIALAMIAAAIAENVDKVETVARGVAAAVAA